MALEPGARLGPYEVVSPLGKGGMGEVYRARDTKLNRDVALKLLPDAFAGDADRLIRFEREAQALAALNHPNIAQIYGLEDRAIVMELVEGQDLSEILHGIALEHALSIARQIAEALEAAHDQGIIHRDLKPANVKVAPEGQVKVLDFGLAKALGQDSASGTQDGPSLATMTSPAMTALGMIVGTAAYMSPEQARGRPADKRADIWAFGVVLFEMLTGQRMYAGETVSDVLAHVLTKEPEWDTLPADTPPPIRRLLRRCLTKDRKNRLRDIGEARIAIEEYLADPAGASALVGGIAGPAPAPQSRWRRAGPVAAAAIAGSLLTGGLAWMARPAPSSAVVTRFSVALPEAQVPGRTRRNLALSPDGTLLAFVGSDQQLYLRPMRDSEARPVSGARGSLSNLVFSPDGGSIAYFDDADDTLQRIETTGGAPVRICATTAPGGLTWSGAHLYWATQGEIRRVAAMDGEPEVLVSLEADQGAFRPQMLPDGRTLLFTLANGTDEGRWSRASIVAQRLDTGVRTTLVESGTDAQWLPTGHLVYAIGGVVFARPFDADDLEVRGGAASAIEGVARASGDTSGGGAHFALSANGTLAYLPGPVEGADGSMLQLAFFDRAGVAEPLGVPPGRYATPRLSPDGRWVAFAARDDQGESIWVYDLAGSGAARRLTFGGNARLPVWSADSQRVTYQSDHEGDFGIFWQRADGTDRPERLTRPEGQLAHLPNAWSPDGAYLLFDAQTEGQAATAVASLMALKASDGAIEAYGGVQSARRTTAQFSPDGRWVAYALNEGQVQAVFVQPFPATGARFQISSSAEDGHHQVWSPDGTEIFFTPGPGARLTGVTVSTAQGFSFGRETKLPRPFTNAAPWSPNTYDISRDGRRFLGLTGDVRTDSAAPVGPEIRVVLNWFEELRQRVPVR